MTVFVKAAMCKDKSNEIYYLHESEP